MAFHISPDQCQIIQIHAERTYPEECCGLLMGHLHDSGNDRVVLDVRQLPNAWTPLVEEYSPSTPELTRSRRYWIDPNDLLKAQREGRDRQLTIIGIYHSHPDQPAVPSECDRTLAWSDYSYLIVSVQQGNAQEFQCWRLDDHHQFQPEAVILTPP